MMHTVLKDMGVTKSDGKNILRKIEFIKGMLSRQ